MTAARRPAPPPVQLAITARVREIHGLEARALRRRQVAALARLLRRAARCHQDTARAGRGR